MHAETETVNVIPEYDVVVVGGGPAGATAAYDLTRAGRKVLLIERGFRIKPCGGAIPPRAVDQFNIPPEQIVAKIRSARMISPADQRVDMPVGDTYVAMVDRDKFDPFLRERAVTAGATLQIGAYKSLVYQDDGRIRLRYLDKSGSGGEHEVIASAVIGADGAKSRVGAQCIPGGDKLKCVFAYHEIVEAPTQDQELITRRPVVMSGIRGDCLRIFMPGFSLMVSTPALVRAVPRKITPPQRRWRLCGKTWGSIQQKPFVERVLPFP